MAHIRRGGSFMYAPHKHAQHPSHRVLSVASHGFLTVADIKGPPRRIGATRDRRGDDVSLAEVERIAWLCTFSRRQNRARPSGGLESEDFARHAFPWKARRPKGLLNTGRVTSPSGCLRPAGCCWTRCFHSPGSDRPRSLRHGRFPHPRTTATSPSRRRCSSPPPPGKCKCSKR